jgi:osomolarity two-component system response regulator SKN7
MAITPGAVMISKMNGGIPPFQDSREDSEDLDNGLTAANTSLNKQNTASGVPLFSAENEDIAMFAAALKGGQSKDQVRSALTSQPLIVRRATYIPEWSVPPRVLLVEDDPVCRNLTTKFLQIFGCTIEVAADGVEAVNKMQTGVYDICMMDITMPNLDGQ